MSRFLIVEDDDTLRDGYGTVLELEGYDVRTATNGRQALKMMDGEWIPDAIFLDLTMPVMSGWEFREAQRSDPRLRDIPIVVLSGDGEDNLESLGAYGHLKKPFRLEDMLQTVSSLAALPPRAASSA